MSTYTNYTVKVRENLSRIRNPGNEDDGLVPERVIFSCNNNIYHGVFAGEMSSIGATFNNCRIVGSMIDNAVLNDVALCCDGNVVELTDLTASVDEIA